ncbi:MAG: ArsR family transcriptional regulator [Rhodocyclaceae bacterium]|jgi:transcription initiation factor IIE alpha subunit|nr:ArsR family transcriptional regulator [Rhodocyclaceae bacterium]MBK6906064.1 ArsR family transcriptional regulator [Rhodocyclaceae bacterium]
MQEIMLYLRKYGQRLDTEIAEGLGVSLNVVRRHISELSSGGQIITCKVTRFEGDKPIEGVLCRMAGSLPVASPGRKPGARTSA